MKYYMYAAVALILASCSHQTKDPIDEKVESLLSQMTLKEKVGQLNQVSSFGDVEAMHQMIADGKIGSILNEVDPVKVNEIQRIAVEESRLGIPIIIARDVIHGYKTIFPIPIGQAATFDPEIVRQGARIASVEASSHGVRWTFAPMIDIARDPRWGRIAEGCGEDPLLTSIMGVAMVEGFQGDSLVDATSMAACAKHFVGYGAAEGGRDYNSVNIPPRLLRNVYLPPFEAAAKAGALTFMTSFNDNDGVPSTANGEIVNDILRGEWGFEGFVVTDWNSAGEMQMHGNCADRYEVAAKSLAAGVDMDMMAFAFIDELPELVRDGKVSEKDVDKAVRRILRAKYLLGLFDNPYVDVTLQDSVLYAPEHLAAAKQAAVESAVLLKNDGVLPLSPSVKRVAVVGPLADAPYEQLGTWCFDGDPSHSVTPLQAIKEIDGVSVTYVPVLKNARDRNASGIPQAVAAARGADVVIAFVGEDAIMSGEAHSMADLNLKGAQAELIKALSATGKPVVTVVMAGRPLTIGEQVEQSSAVLYAFHPGTMAGPALADLLWGKESPSGRLPVTFPVTVGQVPIYYNHYNTGRPCDGTETLLYDIPENPTQTSLGNTSYYLDAGFYPLYPFGYGLTYTTFEYGKPELSATELGVGDVLKVKCQLTNTGDREGTEVAQLYVRDVAGSIARPVNELKGFQRVTLAPGETRVVEFELPISALAFYGLDMQKKVEPGDFLLRVIPNSATTADGVLFTVK